ncbi:MAG TPA: TonB-dependent receptor [Acidobacteriaceae bacterium]
MTSFDSTQRSVPVLQRWRGFALFTLYIFLFASTFSWSQQTVQGWGGVLRDANGIAITNCKLILVSDSAKFTATTAEDGSFHFVNVPAGRYAFSAIVHGHTATLAGAVNLPSSASASLVLSAQDDLTLQPKTEKSTGGEQLSSKAVSSLPLNKRDFSQLLLLAAGTMTDSNGATNFTQQFAVNGQRGVEAVFALDGADISDPEMGGATFSNFNVDAVQEIQSSSGWMPAEIGRGAAGFTNIITRSGASGFHGSFFEFLRNSALDARNFFDHPSIAEPGRIPPFRRNEFGFTNGGPVLLPHIYDGRGKTFYFGQYQGFRQALGTTQVIPVPTADERAGLDSTAYPGDTLFVPVDPAIAQVLRRYPMPNLSTGSYGAHTYATSSKVTTIANQFSIRLDQKLTAKDQLFFRFNYNNLTGPTTNPDQTVLDPSFGIQYRDHQRNGILTYSRTVSPRFSFQSSLSATRSTPSFPTPNHTDPALKFGDGLFEAFNSAAGSVMESFGNLFQVQQTFTFITANHSFKMGGEFRANRDTTYYGLSPNGEYSFGGGTAYSPINIRSASGNHDIHAGDPLPDTLSSLLTGSPFSYTLAVAPPYFSNGDHIGPAAISRNAAAFYFQDNWKITSRLILDYGLRYELYTPIAERARRTSGLQYPGGPNSLVQDFVINPHPPYRFNLDGFGPRVQLAWSAPKAIRLNIGGGVTTIPPNIWQDNFLTGSTPFVVYPRLVASPGSQFQYGFQITPAELPRVYTPGGVDIFANGTKAVAPNTIMDVDRYEHDVALLLPGHQITPLNLSAITPKFGNATLFTWTLGLERHFGGLDASAAYVGTAGAKLPATDYPNAYAGATPEFAPHTRFDGSGKIIGGFGTETVINDRSHSTYHALQTSLQGTIAHGGPGMQASYTWSKSIDDVSLVAAGTGNTGASIAGGPQDPRNIRAEKGPSDFDITHSFTLSAAQDLHLQQVAFLRRVSQKVTAGWELLSISTLSSGSPFTIYSGVQQTGVGAGGADRPDQIGNPHLSTSHAMRADYFGLGSANASYFSIPINIPGGTGPNEGRFGTLGRNTFRGPAFHNFDFSLIKDTALRRRSSGAETIDLQFRSEFFNVFNLVNFGLPANTIRGSGFGQISRTAGNSRQIQFSLKLIY